MVKGTAVDTGFQQQSRIQSGSCGYLYGGGGHQRRYRRRGGLGPVLARCFTRGRHEPSPTAAGINRTQSPPKHTSHARRKTCCHGGVGINPNRGRPLVRLTQLHGSQSAPEQGTTSRPFGSARPSHPVTPTSHPHQSGQRDSNPRHSAWEADALPTELCPHLPDQSINSPQSIPPSPHPHISAQIPPTAPSLPRAGCPSLININTENIFESP